MWDVVVTRKLQFSPSEGLCDGDGEVGEPSILGFRGGKIWCRACRDPGHETRISQSRGLQGNFTTEEGLSLKTTEAALGITPELQPLDIDDALSVEEELQLPVGLTDVVEANALGNGVPPAGRKTEDTPSNGSSIDGIAVRTGESVAQFLVGFKAWVFRGGKVGVQLTLPFGSPHETSRPAPGVTSSAGAPNGNLFIITAVYRLETKMRGSDLTSAVMSLTEPEQFSTQLIIEVLLEEHRIAEGSLESDGQINIRGTLGVE